MAADETRTRLLDAARALLADGGFPAFTLDAVAQRAGVTRMTVYHQFGSKIALIEAVFDSLAIVREGVKRLVGALTLADPLESLAEFVAVFAGVWQEDRAVIRRLHGLASTDPEFAQVWSTREGRRRHGLRAIVSRASGLYGTPPSDRIDDTVEVLNAVIAFDTFDLIAGAGRTFEEVAPLVHALARAALSLEPER